MSLGMLLGSCGHGERPPADIARLEHAIGARLPEGARPLDSYVRYYAAVEIVTEDDLPFTTLIDPGIPEGRRSVTVGVLVQPGIWEGRKPGAYLVGREGLPYAVHGGCAAVNVVYDPSIREIVGLWCNVGEDFRPYPE